MPNRAFDYVYACEIAAQCLSGGRFYCDNVVEEDGVVDVVGGNSHDSARGMLVLITMVLVVLAVVPDRDFAADNFRG